MPHTLTKQERLSSKRDIAALMDGGQWGATAHIRYCYICTEGTLNRIMVSVPKKNFKRAVRRNILKRRLREAYRTQKELLSGTGTDILFFYSSPEVADYAVIREEVALILSRLAR